MTRWLIDFGWGFIPAGSRRDAAWLLVLLGACVAAFVGYGFLASSRGSADRVARDLHDCRVIAGRIDQMRHLPSAAGSSELQEGEIVRLIEQASRTANMTRDQIARIWPEDARRLGQSPYKEKPTRIHLRRVTLRQTVTFLHALCDGQSGLRVSGLRLVAPREAETRELWSVEVTLSYLIFAPSHAQGNL